MKLLETVRTSLFFSQEATIKILVGARICIAAILYKSLVGVRFFKMKNYCLLYFAVINFKNAVNKKDRITFYDM